MRPLLVLLVALGIAVPVVASDSGTVVVMGYRSSPLDDCNPRGSYPYHLALTALDEVGGPTLKQPVEETLGHDGPLRLDTATACFRLTGSATQVRLVIEDHHRPAVQATVGFLGEDGPVAAAAVCAHGDFPIPEEALLLSVRVHPWHDAPMAGPGDSTCTAGMGGTTGTVTAVFG